MRVETDKDRRRIRRKNHIAKDLRTPKYRHQVVEPRSREDEDERRIRRYGILNEWEDN